MQLDLHHDDWLRVDWRATKGTMGDWEHKRVHGSIDFRNMPMARCERCGEMIYHGGRVTNFTPAIPDERLDELLAPLPGPRRPHTLSEFLAVRSLVAGETVFSEPLYPLDVLLPLFWHAAARPKKHFYFPLAGPGYVVSEAVRNVWETHGFTGVEFVPLGQVAKRASRPYHLFKITHLVKPPEPWTGCEYCEQLLGRYYPEKEVEPLNTMPDLFWYYDDALLHRRTYAAMKSAGVADELVVERWNGRSQVEESPRDGRWIRLSGVVVS